MFYGCFSLSLSFRLLLSFTDTYDIFIDSGGSPDAYLSSADINSFLNDSFIFNGTLDAIVNGTVLTHENIIDKNSTKLTNTNATDEDVAELVIMAVTSIVLGLMILITVIGNKFPFSPYSIFCCTCVLSHGGRWPFEQQQSGGATIKLFHNISFRRKCFRNSCNYTRT